MSVIVPKVRQSKKAKALVKIADNYAGADVPVFRIDHRALERDKYAPWGRGIHSGLRGQS